MVVGALVNSLHAGLMSLAVAGAQGLPNDEHVSRLAAKVQARVESPNESCRSPLDLLSLPTTLSTPAALAVQWTTWADL